LGALAQALLQGGAPTTTPGAGISALGAGFGGFGQAYNSRLNSGLQQAGLGMQLAKAQREQEQEEAWRKAVTSQPLGPQYAMANGTGPGRVGPTMQAAATAQTEGNPLLASLPTPMRSILPNLPMSAGVQLVGQALNREAKPPTVQEFYDAQGRPYKAQYDPQKGSWVPVGGAKTPDWQNPAYIAAQERIRRAGKTDITIPIGGDNSADKKLREKLSEEEGKRWSELQGAGIVSSGLSQDFQVLDQLMTVAPQGPITGRLAEMFPGVSSAGDAFTSIVTRVAPSLRTPGSGSTSDIEYEGMLKSLPRLRQQPEANRLIAETMKAKAALNVERAKIVTAYQNEVIDAKTARSRLAELNARSIMSPELRRAISALGEGSEGKTDPLGIR
jgi:hypothetical protein